MAAGLLPAMQNPSAPEVAAVLAAARVQAADVPVSDRAYDEAQAAVAALRPRADELVAEVMADLRYTLRKMDDLSQRRVMASYGATFKSLPGEPADTPPATTGENADPSAPPVSVVGAEPATTPGAAAS